MQAAKNWLCLSFYKPKKKAKIIIHTKHNFKVSPKESGLKDDFGLIS